MTSYESKQRWRTKAKKWIVHYAGGCCQSCGYDVYVGNLAFHHCDPTQKDNGVHILIKNTSGWDSIIEEVDKCVLVCCNCHGEIHAGLRESPSIDHGDRRRRLAEIESWKPVPKTHKFVYCKQCGIRIQGGDRKYCSQTCVHKAQERILWPTNLRELVEIKGSKSAVARMLGVSDHSITRRLGE